jgi:hypothetical protein
MKVEFIAFRKTGRDSERHSVGTLTIQLVDRQKRWVKEFEGVDQYDASRWQTAGYPLDEAPYDCREEFNEWLYGLERQDAVRTR